LASEKRDRRGEMLDNFFFEFSGGQAPLVIVAVAG